MADIEDVVRERLAVRAAHVDLTGDRADLDARIARSDRRRDAVRNGLSLGGAALAVVIVVGLAYVTTSSSPSVRTRLQPTAVTDRSVARAEITGAYTAVFQPGTSDADRVATIDNPTGLLPLIAKLRAEAPPRALDTVRVHVDGIAFRDATHVDVMFSITSTNQQLYPGVLHKTGGAVFADGRWKLTRASFCAVFDTAGVNCPEDAPAPKSGSSP